MLLPRDRFGLALLGVAVLLAVLIGLTQWFSPFDNKSAYEIWTGGRGLLELATGFLTVAAAATAAILAWRSYLMNLRIGVTNRYQKGAELLDARADSSKIAGIELLSVVALQDPAEFQKPVIRTLRQLLDERCSTQLKIAYESAGLPIHRRPPAERSGLVVTTALGAICRTAQTNRWRGMEYDEPYLRIRGVYLHQARIADADMSRLNFIHAAWGEVTFIRCRFDNTVVKGMSFASIRFVDCDMSDCLFVMRDRDGVLINDDMIYVENCRVQNFTLNASPVTKRSDPLSYVYASHEDD